MAVTARLSRILHVTLGEEAADDMVTWMHGVESGRAELRELNELSVSRLEARIGQVEARLGQVEARLDARIEKVESRVSETRHELLAAIERRFSDTLKWLFVFWTTTIAALLLR
jgi:uncharacterized protein YPO0396